MARLVGLYWYISKTQDGEHMPSQTWLKSLQKYKSEVELLIYGSTSKMVEQHQNFFPRQKPHFLIEANNKKYCIIASSWKLKATMQGNFQFEYWYVQVAALIDVLAFYIFCSYFFAA